MTDGNAFLRSLQAKAKMFAPAAAATIAAAPDLTGWVLDPLARWARAAYGERAFDDAATGYAKYALGVWKCQQAYEKNGRYTPEAMPEMMTSVYESEGYMVPYMWAAILIYPFWPSMTRHIAMYRDEFVKALPSGGNVLEVACGHGVLSLLAAETRQDLTFDGSDISPPAIAVANKLLGVSGHAGRAKFQVKDALKIDPKEKGGYKGIVAGMIAEHLLDPRPLFEVIAHNLADNGLVFFSTALESAQRDHTYEFHRESEPIKMAEAVGLRVTSLVVDSGEPVPGGRFLPRALAMILEKAMTLSYEEVRQHVRHRFPFIMVDRVLEVEPGKRIKALKNVTANEIQFLGHFPEFSIMPGVFIIEAIGQSAVILFSLATGLGRGEVLVLGAITNMRFLAPVLPGETMILEAKVVVMTDTAALVEGSATVDGNLVAQGKFSFARKPQAQAAAAPA